MPESGQARQPLTTTTVKWRFPSVHPEGPQVRCRSRRALTLFAFLLGWELIGWLLVGLTIWVAAFFRDPIRTTPRGDKSDRRAGRRPGHDDQQGPAAARACRSRGACRRGIYPRLDFHERVRRPHQPLADRPAAFARSPMFRASSSTPTSTRRARTMSGSISWSRRRRRHCGSASPRSPGLVARRILTFVKEGDQVEAGERVGLIRFGSRVDVYLPAGTGPRVLLGQRAIAGETVIARAWRRAGAGRDQPVSRPDGARRGTEFRSGRWSPMRSPRSRCASA